MLLNHRKEFQRYKRGHVLVILAVRINRRPFRKGFVPCMSLAFRLRRVFAGLMLGVFSLVAACGNSPPHGSTTPYEVNATPPPGLSGPALVAWHVLHDVRPLRDPIALAETVQHVAGPIAPVVRTTPLNAQLNQEDTFWVQPGQQIIAKLVYITPHVYDYVQDGTTLDLSALKASADRFESSLLVTDHRYFGTEWTPGIDDDPHITLLNATALPGDLNGYYTEKDEYPQAVFADSNQREMIYLRVGQNGMAPNTDEYDKTLAHELARMIDHHMRPGDPTWLREGAALLAQHLNGFDASATDTAFLAKPGTQLNTWDQKEGDAAYYGAGFMFLDYFAEHYGGYPVLLQLMSDPAQAPLNFNDVLAENGYSDRFDDVFAKWVMANALNDEPQANNSAYAYKTITDEHAQPQHSVTVLPFHEQDTTPQYSAQYYDAKLTNGTDQTLHISFAGQPTVPLVSAAAPDQGGAFWWSNRGENMDSTLTRSFDLTKLAGQHVTLNFELWYDLEAGYDYGYVEVSADNGATWQPLAITGSHTDNPNGLNLGNGLTGTNSGDGQSWTSVTADLSAYAGKQVQLRFATVTDGSVDHQGMAVAALNIPQLNFTDAATSDTGWTAKGWLRTTNVLPETYTVQAALFGSDGSFQKVVAVPVGADGTGQLAIPHAGSQISRVLVAVAPLAPATTLPASYTLDLSAS